MSSQVDGNAFWSEREAGGNEVAPPRPIEAPECTTGFGRSCDHNKAGVTSTSVKLRIPFFFLFIFSCAVQKVSRAFGGVACVVRRTERRKNPVF